MTTTNNYDLVTGFYDRLSHVILGGQIKNSQISLLEYIPANANILIAGGGTGWLLEEISKIHSSGLTITYVELSTKMLKQAQKREFRNNEITFINKAIQDHPVTAGQFDVVITPFLFDNFSQSTADQVFRHIESGLKPKGLWLYTDFQVNEQSNVLNKTLLKLMFTFFRFVCKIESRQLPHLNLLFSKYQVLNRNRFYNNFIEAVVYQK